LILATASIGAETPVKAEAMSPGVRESIDNEDLFLGRVTYVFIHARNDPNELRTYAHN
jgi:hypothetical protein